MSNCSVESWGNKVVYIQRSPVSFSNTNQLSVINRQLVKVSERQTMVKFALDFQRNYFHFYVCSALISLALDNGIKQTIRGKK